MTKIIHGLINGFSLVDTDPASILPTRSQNHRSANEHRTRVEARLREEIQDGNYTVVDKSQVTLISALAPIEKPDGDIRLIHDLCSPESHSLNDHAQKDPCHYESLDDAIKVMRPNDCLTKVDLRWVYRSIKNMQNP